MTLFAHKREARIRAADLDSRVKRVIASGDREDARRLAQALVAEQDQVAEGLRIIRSALGERAAAVFQEFGPTERAESDAVWQAIGELDAFVAAG